MQRLIVEALEKKLIEAGLLRDISPYCNPSSLILEALHRAKIVKNGDSRKAKAATKPQKKVEAEIDGLGRS